MALVLLLLLLLLPWWWWWWGMSPSAKTMALPRRSTTSPLPRHSLPPRFLPLEEYLSSHLKSEAKVE